MNVATDGDVMGRRVSSVLVLDLLRLSRGEMGEEAAEVAAGR